MRTVRFALAAALSWSLLSTASGETYTPGQKVDQGFDELRTRISERSVEAIGVPCREVVLVRPSTLPKTSSGKLQRALCRRQYSEGELETVA